MVKKIVAAILAAASLVVVSPQTRPAQAAEKECQADADCGKGLFCILAVSPHVCKAPQAAGAKCVRDAVCASGKCDMSKGKPGACQ
jgi:hypothetical protein